MMTRIAQELSVFEDSIAQEFNDRKIPYPVHLESGNEQTLIEIFHDVDPDDYIFGSWRLHLKALLKGVSPADLRAAIHRGESMALRFEKERVYGSAIVGGIVPIALGTALAIKRREGHETVWLFVGDMTAETGIFHECVKYAGNFDLPIVFVIEDNDVSVCTSTREAWGMDGARPPWIIRYHYKSKFPHAGSGKRLEF